VITVGYSLTLAVKITSCKVLLEYWVFFLDVQQPGHYFYQKDKWVKPRNHQKAMYCRKSGAYNIFSLQKDNVFSDCIFQIQNKVVRLAKAIFCLAS
jgi:hypothetical protein